MFDGFGKILQFWSIRWGAKARHSCWSWFDIENDLKFYPSVKNGDFDIANNLISRELEVAQSIRNSGFAGYNYLISKRGFKCSPVRQPGEKLTKDDINSLDKAYDNLKI